MTQAELSGKIGKSAGYISFIENGRVKLSEEIKKDISSALGCRMDEIKDYHDSRDRSGLPDRLKQLRKERGMTQREFAAMAGCSCGMVGALETGRCAPSDELLLRIAKAFDVSYEWLLTGNRNREEDVQSELKTIISYLEKNPLAREKVIAMIEDGTLEK